MATIGENIRERRKVLGMTQSNLAQLMNYQPQTVGKWERGESEPDLTMLCGIANALDFSLEELLGMNDSQFGAPKTEFSQSEFCNSLKVRRCALDLRQTELAAALDLRSQTISKWENGVSLPDLYYIEKLCNFYNIPITQLICARYLPQQNSKMAEVEPEQSGGSIKQFRARTKPFSRRWWVTALSGLLAVVLLVFVMPLSVNSFVGGVSGGGPSSAKPNLPENSDTSGAGDNANKYRLELKTSPLEIYKSSLYEEASIVDEPPPPVVARENFAAVGWTTKEGGYYSGYNDNDKVAFPLVINSHTTIYTRWVYLWELNPVTYINDSEIDEYNYTDSLILESLVVEINEWLKQCLIFGTDLQAAGSSKDNWDNINETDSLFDTASAIEIDGLTYSEPTIAVAFREKRAELQGDKFQSKFDEYLNHILPMVQALGWCSNDARSNSLEIRNNNLSRAIEQILSERIYGYYLTIKNYIQD